MALATPTSRGSGNDKSAGLTLVISPATNFAVGATAFLVMAIDNSAAAGAATTATVTDSQGNTWFNRTSHAANGGAPNNGTTSKSFYSFLPTGLATIDTIT